MTKTFSNNEKKQISILLIGTQMAIGGSQRGLLDQAHWFKLHGLKVAVAFFYDKEGLHEKWQQTVDFPIYDLQAYSYGTNLLHNAGQFIQSLWRLWSLLAHEKFDVVETFTHDSNLLGLPLAWLARVPVRIATHRGRIEGFPLWRQKLHSLLINIGIAHTLIAVSEETRQAALDEGVVAKRVIVIPNGVTPIDTLLVDRTTSRKALGLAVNELFLLSVGRLTRQKGHDILVQAMPKVVSRFPNIKLGICGDGPLRPQLESLIQELDLSKHVQLLGMWSDISPALVSANIFILPSRSEGLSRALMEAMAQGMPVVATNVGGNKSLVTDDVYGLLVPPEDFDKLGESILQLLEHPEMMTRLGSAARKHVLESHSTDFMCQKYYDYMLALLNGR
jgi:glycosyltransferase involved in cell wall biosynthesis